MVTPITSTARAYVRSRATSVMEYTCRIERVSSSTYDDDTLLATPGSRTTVYEGICRIWEISGAATVNVGETDLDISTTQLSTPWDAPLAKHNDEVLILTAPQDSALVGKRFQVQSSAKAGELRATRRYNVTAVSK